MNFLKSYNLNITFAHFPVNLVKKNILYILLFAVIFAGIFLRFKLFLFNQSFYFDEVLLANNIINSNFADFFAPLDYVQISPPFFMIISKFILNISGCSGDIFLRDLILRLFPFLCSVFAVILFPLFVNKAFNNKYLTLISTYIISFNQAAINYSSEFKQYSTEMLITIILLIIFLKINLKDDSIRKIFCFSLIFCLAPWVSLSSFFVLAGGFFVILFDFIKENFKDKFKFSIILLMFFINILCYWFFYLKNIFLSSYSFMNNYWSVELPSFFSLYDFVLMFNDKMNSLISCPFQNYLIWFIIFNLVILFSFKNYKLIMLILLPVCLCIFSSFFKLYPYEGRLILFLLPVFAVIYSQFICLLKETKKTSIVIMIIIFTLLAAQFNIPVQDRVLNKSYIRNLFLKLKEENPDFENIFIALKPEFNYYSSIYDNVPEVHKMDFYEFNIKETDKRMKEIKQGEYYWIYAPTNINGIIMKNYFLKNKNINIRKYYESPYDKSEYVLEFTKEMKK